MGNEKTQVSRLYQKIESEYEKNFGVPNEVYKLYSESLGDSTELQELSVSVWRPDENSDLTTFATNGLSAVKVGSSKIRCEFHLYIESELSLSLENELIQFLANLCLFPLTIKDKLQWWYSGKLTGEVPGFRNCNCFILHPPFSQDGWAQIKQGIEEVTLFNIVPLNDQEHLLKLEGGVEQFVNYLFENEVNIFSGR